MNREKTEHFLNEARNSIRSAVLELRDGRPPADTEGVPADYTALTNATEQAPEPRPSSMVVGLAEGAPGEIVEVEILGGTHLPVQGFGLAIGCNPMLRMLGASESEEMRRLLSITDVEDIKKQHRRGNNWQDNWIQIFGAFYRQLWETDELDEAVADAEAGKPRKVKRSIVEVLIPPMTPLYVLKLKIPDDATPGMEFELDIEHKYGRRLNSNGPVKFLEWPPRYGTSLQVAQYGIEKKDIELVSGRIKVIKPEA